jgi:ketosteroid isomerase-like protein
MAAVSATKDALQEVLAALDGWIEGAKSNHEALGHRDTDCCVTFDPEDIRSMVTDAARSIKAKKRRKKTHAGKPPGVVVEIEDGIAGTRHARFMTTGDTFTLNVQGYLISFDGARTISKIDVPITIKAHIA